MSAKPTAKQTERANHLKEEANKLVKAGKIKEAIRKYNEALQLNQDPIYYCNRAAAYCHLQQYDAAIKDCHSALAMQSDYAKAYGRLGLALSCKNLDKEAIKAYKRALELSPNNETYKQHLEIAEGKLREAEATNPSNPLTDPLRNMPFNLSSVLSNPQMMEMASQMMTDPNIQDMMTKMMSNLMGNAGAPDPEKLENFIRAGETITEGVRESSPELLEQLGRLNLNDEQREEFMRAGETMANRLRESNPELVEQVRRERTRDGLTNDAGTPGHENMADLLRAGQAMAERLRESNPELLEQLRLSFNTVAGGANDDENPGNDGTSDRKQSENRRDRNAH